jgi:hypothetical protein
MKHLLEDTMERISAHWPIRLLALGAACAVSMAASGQSNSSVSASEQSSSSDSTGYSSQTSSRSPINVPAGTALEVELTKGVNTKKVKVGDPVYARLHSDLVVDGWHAVDAGAAVRGSVVEVASGGKKIGGAPRIALAFNSITTNEGSSVPINARYERQGESDTTEDAAKVAGGAAAGAVVGHQVDDDKGSVVGGVLGAAAGAAAAKNTGGELKLESGTVLELTTQSPADIKR